MPIYQYQCTQCRHQMEALQKMSDPKLVDCPECAEPALRKQVTAARFKLKGTGWYETDFKNSGKAPANKNAAAGKDATDPASSGVDSAASTPSKSEAAPAAKESSKSSSSSDAAA